MQISRTTIGIGFSLWLFNDVAIVTPLHFGKEKGHLHLCLFTRLVVPKGRPEYSLLESHFETLWNARQTKRLWSS